jgi:type VI secretion system protein ImpD
LREFKVQVREWPDKPGSYRCVVHLRPHYQLDQMVAAVRLVTELSTGGVAEAAR